jgi:hypothetical protein
MKLRRIAIVLAVAAIAVVATEGAGAARLVSWDGKYGSVYVNEPGAQCYFPFGINGAYRYVLTYPPKVWAFNATAYRDWNWIRFRTHVVNTVTGARTASAPWSAWSLAYDDTPAAYSGTQQLAISSGSGMDYSQYPGNSIVQIEIEWWTQTSRIGGITAAVAYYEQLVAAGTQQGTISYGYTTGC